MSIDRRYQLVLLGQELDRWKSASLKEIENSFSAVGLDLAKDGEVLHGGRSTPDWDGFPVGVWFGGFDPIDSGEAELAGQMIERGFSVFPVVEALDSFSLKVPECLRPINGQEWDAIKLAADVMAGFRLVRRQRQVFISYKRSESSGVANQLFHELVERGYRVFLDTVSVDAGIDFQRALWGRMADVDLLVLLDSPTALTSKWVHEELNRAHDLGMGIVQLVWPNHKRTDGTELSVSIDLDLTDFTRGTADKDDRLESSLIENLLRTVESERIRSLNARRTRLIEGLTSTLGGTGIELLVHPARNVDLLRAGTKIASVEPFVGVPDAMCVYGFDIASKGEKTAVLYNGLGVDVDWKRHLDWLNEKCVVDVLQVDDVADFVRRLP